MSTETIQSRRRAVVNFFQDADYYRSLGRYGLPIALQQFIMASLNMVGIMMIGQLGAVSVAAAGLANQIFFLLNLVLFGITSGSAIFTAQLWGKGDVQSIRKVLGLALSLGLTAGTLFFLLAELFPTAVMGIYSQDPAVVALGADYLRVLGFSFLLYAISACFAAVVRSTGDVQTPLLVTFTAISLNTLLSYVLIFGKLGLPALGVHGAALAVLAARVVECSLLLFLVYRRKSPVAGKLVELLSFNRKFSAQVLRRVLPVMANEILWSTGITTYSIVYARISTDAIAAMNIVGSIDQMALVLFQGLGHACAIMVGNAIGAGDEQRAQKYAGRSMALGALGGLGMGAVVLVIARPLLSVYNVDPIVIEYCRRVLTILGLLLWLRVTNMVLFVGVLRSGGDTRFAFFLDGLIIWLVGVPLAVTGAFVFHLPVYWVYLLVMSEEISKCALGVYRYFSRKWIHNLAQIGNL